MSVVSRNVPKCLLCGSDAVLLDTDVNGAKKYLIYCLNVEHCGLGTTFCNSPEDALKAWEMKKDYADKVRSERRERA